MKGVINSNMFFAVLVKIIPVVTLAILGYFVGRYPGNVILVIVSLTWLFVLFALYGIRYYLDQGYKVEIATLKNRLVKISDTLVERTEIWHEFFKELTEDKIHLKIKVSKDSKLSRWFDAHDRDVNFFPTEFTISKIVDVVGKQVYSDFCKLLPSEDIHIKVDYLQLDRKKDVLRLMHSSNVYFSPGHPGTNIPNMKTEFSYEGKSVASSAWKTEKTCYVADTDKEREKGEDSAFLSRKEKEPIKSIVCIPVYFDPDSKGKKTDKKANDNSSSIFFGVLSLTSSVPNSFDYSNLEGYFYKTIIGDIDPFLKQIMLSEYVNYTFSRIPKSIVDKIDG